MGNANRLREIFDGALDRTGDERRAFLDGACAGDPGLRAKIEALIAAGEEGDAFLSSPTADSGKAGGTGGMAGATMVSPPQEKPGTKIGPYKILQLIGEGGFGSVFMAEQEQPVKRKVALKIIKLGMDTKQVVARFEQERQALAMMDHPNIARVLDAGATELGRPFFVMELVKGDPIVEYCDKNNLSIGERLELFSQVCNAVQHAHTKGIIHRDIKPSNILVSMQDGRPSTKVIDFGIAKATNATLTEKTLFTEHRQLIGTPEYMSPEQAEGSLDIDTRTDVYSLGVLLYELLTGTTPFSSGELRSAAYAEIQRIIREVEPPNPSTRLSQSAETIAGVAARRQTEPRKLGVIVRGELDWIVMKALEKDRQRRYESASALASDIQRHLNHEAVVAGPPSAGYKFRKFVKRNRAQVTVGVVLAAALVLGVIGTSLGMFRAIEATRRADLEKANAVQAAAAETKAKEEAQRRLEQVQKASDILASIFENIDPRQIATSGRPLQAILVDNLDKAVADLEGESIGDSDTVLNVQMKLGWSLLSLGEANKAVTILERVQKSIVAKYGAGHKDTLNCRNSLAMAYKAAGKYDLAISMLEGLVKADRDVSDGAGLAAAKHNLALCYRETGRAAEAVPLLEQVVGVRKAKIGPTHPDTLNTLNALAATYSEVGRVDQAIPLLEETAATCKQKLGPEHPTTLATMNNLGLAYSSIGKAAKAVEVLEEVLRVSRASLGPSNPGTMATMNSLGSAYRSAGHPEKAVPILEEALPLMRARHGNDYPNTMNTMTTLAGVYWSLGQLDKSVPLFEEALKLEERNFGKSRPETRMTGLNLAINYRDAGRFTEALPLLEEAFAASKKDRALSFSAPALADVYARLGKFERVAEVVEAAETHVRGRRPPESVELAGELVKLGQVLLKAGDGAGAERLLRESLGIREKVQPEAWTTFNTKSLLGEALTAEKKYEEAEALLVQGYGGLKAREAKIPKGAEMRIPEALDRLVGLYQAMGKADEAKRWGEERAKYPASK